MTYKEYPVPTEPGFYSAKHMFGDSPIVVEVAGIKTNNNRLYGFECYSRTYENLVDYIWLSLRLSISEWQEDEKWRK